MAGGVEHGVDLDFPEAPGVDVVQQLRRSLGGAECPAVRAVLGHRVVGLGGGDQPGADVEVVTRQAAVIAGPIGAFVVTCGQVGERGEQGATAQDALAQVWVQPDSLPLPGAESASMIPDPAWDADLADVVHQRRSTQSGGLVDGQPSGSSCCRRQVGDAGGVAAEPRGLHIGEVGNRAQRRVEVVGGDRPCRRRLGIEHLGARVVADLGQPVLALAGQHTDHRRVVAMTAPAQPAPRRPRASPLCARTVRRPERRRRCGRPAAPRPPPDPTGDPCRPSARRRGPAPHRRHRPTRAGGQGGRPPRSAPTSYACSSPGRSAPGRSAPPGERPAGRQPDGAGSDACPRQAGPSGSAPLRR